MSGIARNMRVSVVSCFPGLLGRCGRSNVSPTSTIGVLRLGLCALLLALLPGIALSQTAPPRIFYTDLVSGPNAGGQNNNGVFVTLYGNFFGATRGSSTVTVGGGAVASYPVWTNTKVTLQLGASAATGNIVLTTSNGASNGMPFTVRAGNIYFVATSGSDSANGSFAAPWQTLTHARDTIVAGDTIYAMNGVAQTADDGTGWNTAFGLTTGGTASQPMAMVVYPGASATIGNINGPDSGIRGHYNVTTTNAYWVIAGFTLRGVSEAMTSFGGNNWRIIGNDMSCPNGDGQSACFEASIMTNVKFLGNTVHDTGFNHNGVTSSTEYHGVYFSTDSNHFEIGWGTILNVHGGRGIQIHSSPLNGGGSGDPTGHDQFDFTIHDNVIHDTQDDGIILATIDPSQGPIQIYNNLIYNAGEGPNNPEHAGNWSCINIQSYTNTGPAGSGTVEVYNNTMYACGTFATPPYNNQNNALEYSGPNPNVTYRIRNNLIFQTNNIPYMVVFKTDGSMCGPTDNCPYVFGSNNLFFGSGAAPTNTNITNSVNQDPLFVNAAQNNFHVGAGSPVIDAGLTIGTLLTDLDGVTRPQGSAFDIGAYEVFGGGGGSTKTLSASPSTLAFGNVLVGGNGSLSTTITNTGNANVTISSAGITGTGFTITNQPTYPDVLGPNGTASYTAQFAPTGTGGASGTLTVASDASNSPTAVQLTGTGVAATKTLSASPSTLAFGNVGVGGNSSLSTTITNTGNVNVTISSASATGTGYTITGQPSLPDVLAPGGTATYTVKFAPTATGIASGTLSVTSDASNSPTAVSLTGTGVASTMTLSASPTTLAFGTVAIGGNGSLTTTITNTGNSSVTISSSAITGTGMTITGQPSYPDVLAPNGTATYTVKFAPATTGTVSGNLTVTSNATNSPTVVSLSGTGVVGAAISIGKTGSNGTTAGDTDPITATWTGGGSTAGSDAIIVVVYGNLDQTSNAYTTSNVTDSAGNTYHLDQTITHPHAGVVYVFSCLNATAASSVTVTPPAFDYFQFAAMEYKGLPTSSALDVAGAVNDNGFFSSGSPEPWTTNATGGLATQPELVLAINADVYGDATAFSASGYTQEVLQATSTGEISVLDKVVTSTGSVTPSGTYTANGATWVGSFVMTYKGSAGGGSTKTLSASPTALAFGNVIVGNNGSLSATITNTGNVNVTLSSAAITGAGYTITTQPTYPDVLAPNGTATYTVKFAPAAAGSASGTLSVASDATNSPTAVSLTGTGVAAVKTAAASPTVLAFGNVLVGGNGSLSTTITNTGNVNVTLSSAAITGVGYTIISQPSLPDVLTPGGTATYTVQFAPAATGISSGTLSVTSDATNSPTVISLTGTGIAVVKTASASPATLAFGNVTVGGNSSLSTTITNTGNVSVTLSASSITGTGYTITSQPTYPDVLAPGSTANYTVKFAPTATGSSSGTLSVTSDATNSPTTVSLTGTGVAAAAITIGKVGSNGTTAGDTAPISATWNGGGSTIGSDAIIVVVYGNLDQTSNSYTASNVKDSAGNTYHLDQTITHPHLGKVYVFSCLNAAAASSVTVTPPAFDYFQFAAMEYKGLPTSGALDKAGTVHDNGFFSSGSPESWTTNASGTLATQPELVLAINAEVYGSATAFSASGYTQEVLQANSTGEIAVLDKVVTATSSVTPSGTYTANGGTWVGSFVMTYK